MDTELIKKALDYYNASQNELTKYASILEKVHNEHSNYVEKIAYYIDKEVEKGNILEAHSEMYKKAFSMYPSKFVEFIIKNAYDKKMVSESNGKNNTKLDHIAEFCFS